MKVLIAIPCCRDWKPAFGSALIGLVHYSRIIDFNVYIMQGASVLPKARQGAVRKAIDEGYSHILFLDDDMGFPPDLLEVFSSHHLPVVAANYTRKTPNPITQTCGIDGQPVKSFGKTGVEEVGWIGFGAVLIELDKIKDIENPLFETRWMPERNDFVGEDYYFCGKVRAHGIKVYIDHDVSNKVSHIGDYAYREVNSSTDEDLWGSELNTNFSSLDTILHAFQLPIGSLYFNADVATNPATLLGYGTWVAFGQGRVLIGVGSGTDANGDIRAFTNGETGGEYEHTLTLPEIPAHAHDYGVRTNTPTSFDNTIAASPQAGNLLGASGSGGTAYEPVTDSVGGDDPHTNVQPYIAIYAWRRSA